MAAHVSRAVRRGCLRLALFVAAALGCAGSGSLYSWGRYENVLWESYQAKGDPAMHAAMLEDDVRRAAAEGQRVAPGVHAHIGFLRFASGDLGAAREHFLTERELFPESQVFIERVLDRMEGQSGLPEPPERQPPEIPSGEPSDTGGAPRVEPS